MISGEAASETATRATRSSRVQVGGDRGPEPPDEPGQQADLDRAPDQVAGPQRQGGERHERHDEVRRVVERVEPGLEAAPAEDRLLRGRLRPDVVEVRAVPVGDDRPAGVEGGVVGLLGVAARR